VGMASVGISEFLGVAGVLVRTPQTLGIALALGVGWLFAIASRHLETAIPQQAQAANWRGVLYNLRKERNGAPWAEARPRLWAEFLDSQPAALRWRLQRIAQLPLRRRAAAISQLLNDATLVDRSRVVALLLQLDYLDPREELHVPAAVREGLLPIARAMQEFKGRAYARKTFLQALHPDVRRLMQELVFDVPPGQRERALTVFASLFWLAPNVIQELRSLLPDDEPGAPPTSPMAGGSIEDRDFEERFASLSEGKLDALILKTPRFPFPAMQFDESPQEEFSPADIQEAIERAVREPGATFLLENLHRLFGHRVRLSEVQRVEVIEEKHGRYQIVFRVQVTLSDGLHGMFGLIVSRNDGTLNALTGQEFR
ncbi:MAG TPA: hypothetical protein VJB16_01105, partial [archaeon]|nr:hypothetical protein [archaeon]